jgi:retron-type reverse transcriptase
MIALIPEKQNPKTVDDYRPISLLNYSLKVLTKLIANRLQPVMNQLIHENQCGFIKERSIQDCLGWAFQFLHICHHSKKEIVILKLDFQKAFEKIEHRFILQILEHKGFGPKWTSWIRNLLQSGSSSVLLNGILGKPFTYKRGVKQGDPLSPLLFVLAADFLQSIVNKAWHMSILKHPICEDFGSNFPIVQYADDTLLILLASASILFTLERSLFGFGN